MACCGRRSRRRTGCAKNVDCAPKALVLRNVQTRSGNAHVFLNCSYFTLYPFRGREALGANRPDRAAPKSLLPIEQQPAGYGTLRPDAKRLGFRLPSSASGVH